MRLVFTSAKQATGLMSSETESDLTYWLWDLKVKETALQLLFYLDSQKIPFKESLNTFHHPL